MEYVGVDGEGAHLGVADLDAFFVGPLVETRLGFRRTNQFDDSQSAFEWPAPPVLRDMAEHAALDLIPF
jgi:hypothetical protein